MATFKRATMNHPKADTGDIRPNNPLQSDFDAEDSGSSVDADERYLRALGYKQASSAWAYPYLTY
ncbi:hypothetical protein KC324_g3782, partial [Hortaea werneckii]